MGRVNGVKIGQFCEFTGFSEQAVRYYEEMGLLHPDRRPGSKYRYYTGYDLISLMQLRQVQCLTVPLKELAGASNRLDTMDALLERRRQALEAELEALEERIERIKTLQRRLRHPVGAVARQTISPIYRLMLSDPAVLSHPNTPGILRSWLEIMPFSHFTVIIPQAQLADPGVQVYRPAWGIGVIQRYLGHLKASPAEPAALYPRTRCLGAHILVDDPLRIRREELSPFFDYLAAHEQLFSGDMYGLLMYTSPGGQDKSLLVLHVEATLG